MKHIKPDSFSINQTFRNNLNGHRSFLIWFTGLSGSGKSTLANLLEKSLHEERIHTYLLDGDHVRLGLNQDLTFSETDRSENLRRVGEVGKLMVDAGLVTLAAFVSPFQKDRDLVKSMIGRDKFIEIYVSTPLDECIRRDVKQLYRKALQGEISNFTGISSPYELPKEPSLSIDTTNRSKDDCIKEILALVKTYL